MMEMIQRERERNLNNTIVNVTNSDVFTEFLKSEDCVAIFIIA